MQYKRCSEPCGFRDLMFTRFVREIILIKTVSIPRDPMRVPFLLIVFVAAITTVCGGQPALAIPIQESAEAAIDGTSTWEIDNQQASLVCAVSHYGLSFIYGRFNTCSGSVEMNFQEPDQTKFEFEVDPDSIDTNDASRDISLRGESGLDARQYSTIKFESQKVEADDQQIAGKTKRTFKVTGNLSMHGETRRVTIPIELLAIGNGPDKQLRCGFMSRFVVSRSEFGLNALPDSIGDSVAVTFCFQAVRQEKAPAAERPAENKLEEQELTEKAPTRFRFNKSVEAPTDEDARRQELEDLFGTSDPSSTPDAPNADDLPTAIELP